jgi:hypothetical protein
VLALAGGMTILGVFFANTGHPFEEHFSGKVQRVPPALKAVPLNARDHEAARIVAERFIDTAVLRQHIDDSWELTAPALRQGFTRAQWRSGNIPVVPFPANAVGGIRYRVDWSGIDHIYLKVAIVPKPNSLVDGQAYDMGLQRMGPNAGKQWKVDYWASTGIGSPSPAKRAKLPPAEGPKAAIGAAWILLPVGLIAGLLLLIPIGLGIRGRYRVSRANRLYRSTL